MEQRQRQSYEERFLRAYERFEKPLFRLVVAGFALIVLSQLALGTQTGRQLLSSADRLEGQKTSGVLTTTASSTNEPTELTIRPVGVEGSLPKAWVKVNGVPVTAFMKPEVSVKVKEGDVVTVDTSQIPGVYRFEIDHNNPRISYPVPGTLVEGNTDKTAEIGPVLFSK